jgi:hypothetical protein
VQELSAWLNKDKGDYFIINHPSYYTIMLKPGSIRPRVIVYIRKTAPFSYRVREDLIQDPDLLVIEISDPSLGKLLLINLYNEKALDENLKTQKSGQTTINRALLQL